MPPPSVPATGVRRRRGAEAAALGFSAELLPPTMMRPTPAAARTPPPMTRTLVTGARDVAESKSASADVGHTLLVHASVAFLSFDFAIRPVTTPPTSAAPPTPAAMKPTSRSGLPFFGSSLGGAPGWLLGGSG